MLAASGGDRSAGERNRVARGARLTSMETTRKCAFPLHLRHANRESRPVSRSLKNWIRVFLLRPESDTRVCAHLSLACRCVGPASVSTRIPPQINSIALQLTHGSACRPREIEYSPRNVLATQSTDLHISLSSIARALGPDRERAEKTLCSAIESGYQQFSGHCIPRDASKGYRRRVRSGGTRARQARATKRSANRFVRRTPRFDCGNVSVQRRPEAPLERAEERANKEHFNQRTNVIGKREANYNGLKSFCPGSAAD